MGLMRAFTLKRASGMSTRTFSTLKGRPQISLPTELISSTNNITYTAPSVESMQQKAAAEQFTSAAVVADSETASVTNSDGQSEQNYPQTPMTPTTASESSSRRSSHVSTGSEPSLTDASSVSSMSTPNSPSARHTFGSGTTYFVTDSFSKPSSSTISLANDETVDPFTVPVPALPRRAPSHSKREHERLAHRRSQRISIRPAGLEAASHLADDLLSPSPLSPAIMELPEVEEEIIPQVTVLEIAEEPTLEQLMASMIVEDEDVRYMRESGLKKFSIGGYLNLVGDAWDDESIVAEGIALVA